MEPNVSAMKGLKKFFVASHGSRLGRRILRSNKAVFEEQFRQLETGSFLIHPFSKFRCFWDILMTVVLVFTLLLLPVNVAFYRNDNSAIWTSWNCIIDTLFLIDIFVNFRTGYVVPSAEEIVLDWKRIAKNYISSWFIVDALSSLPIDYIVLGIESSGTVLPVAAFRLMKLTKLLSLIRMLRISRLLRYVHKLEELLNVKEATIRMVNIVLLMFMVCHWNACLQFLVVNLLDYPSDSWVVKAGYKDKAVQEQYLLAMFRAVSHMTSCGYGLSNPTTNIDLILVTISITVGCTCYATFIASFSYLLQSYGTSARMYSEKTNEVKEYMKYKRVPQCTQKRVMRYYERKYQKKLFDQEKMFSEQSDLLRKEVVRQTCRSLIDKIPLFKSLETNLLDQILGIMHHEVFLEGDVILEAGTVGKYMYFIDHGSVEVLSPQDDPDEKGPLILSDGDYFGATSLLVDVQRNTSVVALENCDLYSVQQQKFLEACGEYPAVFQTIAFEARCGSDYHSCENNNASKIERALHSSSTLFWFIGVEHHAQQGDDIDSYGVNMDYLDHLCRLMKWRNASKKRSSTKYQSSSRKRKGINLDKISIVDV